MNYNILNDFSEEILSKDDGPFISIYLPTTRYSTGANENSILFKNLVRKVEAEIKEYKNYGDFKKTLKELNNLANDNDFWNYQLDSLAVLADKKDMYLYKLQRNLDSFYQVSDSFYIKPLLNAYQVNDNYRVLALDKKEFKLYEGNRFAVREVIIPEDEDFTVSDIYEDEQREHNVTAQTLGSRGDTLYRGGSETANEKDKNDTVRFFRMVDRYIDNNYFKDIKVPLILLSLPEHTKLFKSISHNNNLLTESIRKNPASMNLDEIRAEAWKILKPDYMDEISSIKNNYEINKNTELSSSDLNEISIAAFQGRIYSMLIKRDLIINGEINKENGFINIDKNINNDILNDIAILALKNKSKVLIVPDEELDYDSGVIANFRY